MGDWYLEFFPSQPGKKGKQFLINKKMTIVGRAEECDLRLQHKTISRKHARVELIHDGLIVTDMNSSNGTYVNNKRISATTKLKSGDLLKIGNAKFFVRKQSASAHRNELNPALYFPGEDRRENIPTLPLYLGYNSKTKKAEATVDPYDDKNLLKIDLDDKGFYCRNIAGAHDVTINNMEFKQMRLQNGDNITVKQFDVVFEMYTGNKTGVENSLGGIREYDQTTKRRPVLLAGIILSVIVLVALIYLLYPKIENKYFVDWREIGSLVNEEVSTNKASIAQAFDNVNTFFEGSHQIFEPLMQYKTDYTTVRGQYLKARNNKLISLAASAVSPGALESIDGIFGSMDALFRLQKDIADNSAAHLEFYNSLQSLPGDSTESSLRRLRKVALNAHLTYKTLLHKLGTVRAVHNEIRSMTTVLQNISGLQIFDSLQGILFNLGSDIDAYINSMNKLKNISGKIGQIIPE